VEATFVPVNPKQFALYERDQKLNERPAVYTYRRTPPGIPAKTKKKSTTGKAVTT